MPEEHIIWIRTYPYNSLCCTWYAVLVIMEIRFASRFLNLCIVSKSPTVMSAEMELHSNANLYGGRENSMRWNFRKHMQMEKAPTN